MLKLTAPSHPDLNVDGAPSSVWVDAGSIITISRGLIDMGKGGGPMRVTQIGLRGVQGVVCTETPDEVAALIRADIDAERRKRNGGIGGPN